MTFHIVCFLAGLTLSKLECKKGGKKKKKKTRETYLILEITFKHKFQKEIKRLGIENLEEICEGQLWAI